MVALFLWVRKEHWHHAIIDPTKNERGSLVKPSELTKEQWDAMRDEYVTAGSSYRKLSKKYGISFGSIQARSKEEDWQQQKKDYTREYIRKSVDAISDQNSSRIVRAYNIGDQILNKLEVAVAQSEDPEMGVDVDKLRKVAATLKDLKEIKLFANELDKKEQESRIKKLQKDAEDEVKDKVITVKFEDDMEDYTV